MSGFDRTSLVRPVPLDRSERGHDANRLSESSVGIRVLEVLPAQCLLGVAAPAMPEIKVEIKATAVQWSPRGRR